ncbi:MAG TPA: hypothetical protein PKD61_22835, partial [Polyangiaceae bacterium]|nr:hypothetical protein [Polyangiaceae bacterium]
MKWPFLMVLLSVGALGCSSDPACADCTAGGGGGSGSGGTSGAGAIDSGVDAGVSLAQQYCDCMLTSCHDAYHATFGPET